MSYQKTNWQDSPSTATPLDAANLNKLEAGVANAAEKLGTASTRSDLSFDTAANWASHNPILGTNEVAHETDTGMVKVGDGVTHYTSLHSTDSRFEQLGLGQRARGVVCFTYDDGFASANTVAGYAASRGQTNTFFITSDNIGTGGKVTSSDVLALYNAGHDIGGHGQTHTDMTTLTAAQRATQHDNCKAAIEAIIGAGNMTAWAYPYGARNTTTDQELYLRWDRIFGTGYTLPARVPLENRMGRFLYGRQQWLQSTHSTVLDLIRLAASAPIVVVFYCHDPGNASGSFATDPTLQQVQDAYNLCKTLGVPSVGISKILPTATQVRNAGFESGLDGWQQPLGTVTGLTVESIADTPVTGLSGTNSLHILASAATTANFQLEQNIPVIPGLSYNASMRWHMTAWTAGQVQFDFMQYAGDGSTISTTTSVLNSVQTWGRPTRTLTLATNCDVVGVRFTVPSGFQGEAWIDHVDFRPTQFGMYG